MKSYGTLIGELPTGVETVVEGALLRIYFDFARKDAVRSAGSEDVVVEDQYVCENVDVEGAIIMDRYDANKRDAIFANLEMARDTTSGLTEEKRTEYLQEYADYQNYRTKAKEVAKAVLENIK